MTTTAPSNAPTEAHSGCGEQRNGHAPTAIGYTIRWRQRRRPTKRQPEPYHPIVTGKIIHHDLDHVVRLCQKVNAGFQQTIEQWPVRYSLTDKGQRDKELEDLRSIMGLNALPEGAFCDGEQRQGDVLMEKA